MQRNSQSAGFFLAASIIAGAIIGATQNQPSAGIVIGTAIGVAISVALWLVDRRRG